MRPFITLHILVLRTLPSAHSPLPRSRCSAASALVRSPYQLARECRREVEKSSSRSLSFFSSSFIARSAILTIDQTQTICIPFILLHSLFSPDLSYECVQRVLQNSSRSCLFRGDPHLRLLPFGALFYEAYGAHVFELLDE